MSDVLYLPEGCALSEMERLHSEVLACGGSVDKIVTGQELDDALAGLSEGDAVWVDSFGACFGSLLEVLSVEYVRGVRLRSLAEGWFGATPVDDPQAYHHRLYELGASLHAGRTRKGLERAAKQGRKPGRPMDGKDKLRQVSDEDRIRIEQVDRLRRESEVSLREACEQAGITVYGYYNTRKHIK